MSFVACDVLSSVVVCVAPKCKIFRVGFVFSLNFPHTQHKSTTNTTHNLSHIGEHTS